MIIFAETVVKQIKLGQTYRSRIAGAPLRELFGIQEVTIEGRI